jgi:SRSO17 transposase
MMWFRTIDRQDTVSVEHGAAADEGFMAYLGGEGSEVRFGAYVEALIGVIGHADRAGPLRDYCVGLTAPLERKSVEPMAAATAPARTSAQHQSLLHFVGKAPWSDERVLAKVRGIPSPGAV